MSYINCDYCGSNVEIIIPEHGIQICPCCEAPIVVSDFLITGREKFGKSDTPKPGDKLLLRDSRVVTCLQVDDRGIECQLSSCPDDRTWWDREGHADYDEETGESWPSDADIVGIFQATLF